MISQTVLEMTNVMHNAEITVTIDELCPICFADWTKYSGVYQHVSLNDEVQNSPPNSYRALAKS